MGGNVNEQFFIFKFIFKGILTSVMDCMIFEINTQKENCLKSTTYFKYFFRFDILFSLQENVNE